MNVTELTQKIKPFVLGWLEAAAGGDGPFAPSPHELNGVHHTGTLAAAQYPDALLRDGSRSLTGNLSVGAGITIDGVDISAFKAAYDTHILTANAHHDPVTIGAGGLSAKLGLTGQVLTLASIAHSDLTGVSADQHHAGFVGLSGDSGGATPDASDLIMLAGGNGIVTSGAGNVVTLAARLGTGLTFASGQIVLNWSGTPNNVNLTASAAGSSSYAARIDHRHQLDVSITPTWTALHTFSAGIDVAGTLEFQGAQSITSTTGDVMLAPAGDLILDPVGNDVLPNTNYDINLGLIGRKYLTVHAAELWVETLVAQDTIATIGGRILVGPTTVLMFDIGTGNTTIYVKHNELAVGDRIYLEADGKVEFMAITAGPTGAGPYGYTVTRNLDGSGANSWYAGDAVFNTGAAGDGFIDIYSVHGVKSATQYGPTIVGNVRNSATYNDWSEAWAIGNLNGLYGYSTNTYGVGLGKYASGQANIVIDPTNGVRLRTYTTTILQIKNADQKGYIVGPLYLDTAGGIYQGTGTFASPTTGLKIWNDGGVGRIGGYNASVLQWYAATDGKLYAGAGSVISDADGITVISPAAVADSNAYKFSDGTYKFGGLYTYCSPPPAAYPFYTIQIRNDGTTVGQPDGDRYVTIESRGKSGYSGYVGFTALSATSSVLLFLSAQYGSQAFAWVDEHLLIAPSTTGYTGAQNFTVDGTAAFSEYIYHYGDTDTYQRYQPDRWTLRCGGVDMLDVVEDTDDYIRANANLLVYANLDFRGTGVTTVYPPTDRAGLFYVTSSTYGGFGIVGYSGSGSHSPITISAFIGSTTPTVSPMIFAVGKTDGAGGAVAVAASEKAFTFYNRVTMIAELMGDGDLEVQGTIKTALNVAWDLGGYTAGAPAATGYVSVTLNGTVYKFLAST